MVLIEHIAMSKCRLCHSKPGEHVIHTDKKFVREIYECIKIKVNDKAMGLLPPCVCEECKKTIKDFFLYRQHIRKIDQSLRNILLNKTSQCDDDLKKPSLNILKCSECLVTFSNASVFKKHLKSHSSKYATDFYTRLSDRKLCLTCNEHFKNLEDYESHQCNKNDINSEISFQRLNDVVEEESPVIKEKTAIIAQSNSAKDVKKVTIITELDCKICKEKFSTKQELENHRKGHKRKYVCTWKDCEKILNSAYTLKTHELKHEGKRSFLCVTCGKGFITKNSLTCHEKIHLEVKGYICKLCNIGFSVRSNLRAHEKKHHEGIRFYCSQCTKAFVSKCSLERHERIHTGIKEFQCESCPSAFYTNKELVKHQRYHQGLRLHKCDECFKTFFERHHLVIHLRSHTGERPYVCKVPNCGKSFMESQKLKRHHNAKHAQN